MHAAGSGYSEVIHALFLTSMFRRGDYGDPTVPATIFGAKVTVVVSIVVRLGVSNIDCLVHLRCVRALLGLQLGRYVHFHSSELPQ